MWVAPQAVSEYRVDHETLPAQVRIVGVEDLDFAGLQRTQVNRHLRRHAIQGAVSMSVTFAPKL